MRNAPGRPDDGRPRWTGPLPHPFYSHFIKRALDIALALLLAIPGLALMLPLAVWVKLDSSGAVFYRAPRGGYQNKPFKILKFRTMVTGADLTGGCTALNDARVTRAGRVLRASKLDEIPQLINILKGDMSFIGPRPELLKYTDRYTPQQQCILWVRPGISDDASLAFISQDEIVGEEDPVANYEKYILDEKNAMRVRYAMSQSFRGDMRLLMRTCAGVFGKIRRIAAGRRYAADTEH
jgi:lipopolysaccharide/colanic/teichoic acid biosynthesis glycosyltransferase